MNFEFDRDVDGYGKSAWTRHRIRLVRGEETIGRLRVARITHETFRSYCPTIFHFAGREKGRTGFREHLNEDDWAGLVERLREHRAWPTSSGETLEDHLNQYEEYLDADYQHIYGRFYHYHVGRFDVGYSKVQKEERRKGYGEQLYRRAARWCEQEFDAHLHAASLQRPGAEGVWDKFAREEPENVGVVEYINPDSAEENRERRYLSFEGEAPDQQVRLDQLPKRLSGAEYARQQGVAIERPLKSKAQERVPAQNER